MSNPANMATITEVIEIMGDLGYKGRGMTRTALKRAVKDGTLSSTRRASGRGGRALLVLDLAEVEAWASSRLDLLQRMKDRTERARILKCDGHLMSDIAASYGVSTRAVYRWLRKRCTSGQ